MMQVFRRRRYLVHSFQYRLLAAVMVYFLAALAGIIAVVFGPLVFDFSGRSSFTMEKYEAAGVFLRLHQQFWPVVLLLVVLIIFHSILISHRIGGPLYRFRSVFRTIAEGDLSMNVQLHKHDYAKQEAHDLSEMILSLRDRLRNVRSECARLSALTETVRQDNPQWREFERSLRTLEGSLDSFKLDPPPRQSAVYQSTFRSEVEPARAVNRKS